MRYALARAHLPIHPSRRPYNIVVIIFPPSSELAFEAEGKKSFPSFISSKNFFLPPSGVSRRDPPFARPTPTTRKSRALPPELGRAPLIKLAVRRRRPRCGVLAILVGFGVVIFKLILTQASAVQAGSLIADIQRQSKRERPKIDERSGEEEGEGGGGEEAISIIANS